MRASAVALACALGACGPAPGGVRAFRATSRAQLIGGPGALADEGDFILENDLVRFAILKAGHSPGPGLFGGSLIDADLVRPESRFNGDTGLDQFGEIFPVANLFVPSEKDPMHPDALVDDDVRIVEDGSSPRCPADPPGAPARRCAIVRAGGPVDSYLTALTALQNFVDPLDRVDTDFVLHEGDRHVEMVTTMERGTGSRGTWPDRDAAEPTGAPADALDLPALGASTPLVDTILGDRTVGHVPVVHGKGMVGGDFAIFGKKVSVWVPGSGFDYDSELTDRILAGENTLGDPQVYDVVAGVGDRVSYALASLDALPPAGAAPPTAIDPAGAYGKLLAPFFTAALTATFTHAARCLVDASDDATCDDWRFARYRRMLVVGDGSVDSLLREVWRVRGVATGEVRGGAYDRYTGAVLPGVDVYALGDPLALPSPPAACDHLASSPDDASYDALEQCAVARSGQEPDVGAVSHAKTNVGTDPRRDGTFALALPAGRYYLVARAPGRLPSRALRVTVEAGKTVEAALGIERAGELRYRVLDESGLPIGAKLTFLGLPCDASDPRCDAATGRYGRRYLQMGDSRTLDDLSLVVHSATGEGSVAIAPGRYRLIVSHGTEYTIDDREVDVPLDRAAAPVEALCQRVVDTRGWISADFHVHGMNSFDSGVRLADRALSYYVEGIELLSSSDHDFLTDYGPSVRALGIEGKMATEVGLEATTIELGHFLGFPLVYDQNARQGGAFEWYGLPPDGFTDPSGHRHDGIWDRIRALGENGPDRTIVVVAHPRDGFFGYFDQYSIDPYDLSPGSSLLHSFEPHHLFDRFSADFDALEILNGKRMDFIRTPSVGEGWDFDPRVRAIRADRSRPITERRKAEMALAASQVGAVLARTPAESAALGFGDDDRRATRCARGGGCPCTMHAECAIGDRCGPAGTCVANKCEEAILSSAAGARDLPCTGNEGAVDDWFRLMNAGVFTAGLGNSDSHVLVGDLEAGVPRTYVCSPTDDPRGIVPADVEAAVRRRCAIATNGPFVELFADPKPAGGSCDGAHPSQPIGSLLTATHRGADPLCLRIVVQAADWYDVTNVELVKNGATIHAWPLPANSAEIVKLDQTVEDTPGGDAWYVAIATGDGTARTLSPVYQPVTAPNLAIAEVFRAAFSGVNIAGFDLGALLGAAPQVPQVSPVVPFAVTNPILVNDPGDSTPDAVVPRPDAVPDYVMTSRRAAPRLPGDVPAASPLRRLTRRVELLR